MTVYVKIQFTVNTQNEWNNSTHPPLTVNVPASIQSILLSVADHLTILLMECLSALTILIPLHLS